MFHPQHPAPGPSGPPSPPAQTGQAQAARPARPGLVRGSAAALALLLPLAALLAGRGEATRAQAEATVFVNPPDRSVARGRTFEVQVDIRDAVDLGAFQLSLGFPPDKLAYRSIRLGSFLGQTGRPVQTFPPVVQSGMVSYVAVTQPGSPGPSGGGTLAILSFEAIADGAGDLLLSEVRIADSLNGNRFTPRLEQGRFLVGAATPEPTPTRVGFRIGLPLAMLQIERDALPTPAPGLPPSPSPEPSQVPSVTPTRTATAVPSPTPSNPATPTPSKPDPRIGGIQCTTTHEWVSIVNQGGEAIDLDGWMMHSTTGIQTYTFRETFMLGPGETMYLDSGPAAPEPGGNRLRWTTNYIWNELDGDTAQLKSPRPVSEVIDTRDCPPR